MPAPRPSSTPPPAGVELDAIRSISETQGYEPPQPYLMGAMAREAAAAPVPVEAGELTFSINVSVTWELGENN